MSVGISEFVFNDRSHPWCKNRNYFLEYRSPRYPKMGAVMMKTMAKADCKSPASESPIWNAHWMSVKIPAFENHSKWELLQGHFCDKLVFLFKTKETVASNMAEFRRIKRKLFQAIGSVTSTFLTQLSEATLRVLNRLTKLDPIKMTGMLHSGHYTLVKNPLKWTNALSYSFDKEKEYFSIQIQKRIKR